MAVYTHVSDTEFRTLLARYAIGDFVRADAISEGVSNTNYLLHSSEKKYIFTIYEKMVETKDLPYFLHLMDHISKGGVPCPLPIRDRAGEIIQHVAGRPAAITSFLEGKSVMQPGSIHCAEMGGLMAKLHLAARGFALRRANDLAPVEVGKRFAAAVAVADTVKPGLRAELEDAYRLIAARWPHGLPEGVIHGDMFPDNVFFLEGRASGIIDFYFACNDFLAYDIAIALNAWCFEANGLEFNITKARHLLRGYHEVRPLDAAELKTLPVLASGAALRFLLTRLNAWVHRQEGALVTPKDPMDYLRRLRFHLQVKGHAEYGL